MKELFEKVIEEGEWQSLRFTVYNYLEEHERYQQNLERMGYDNSYEDLEGKAVIADNMVAKQFKNFIENKLQNGTIVVTVCVFEGRNYFTIVKPKNVDMLSILKVDNLEG